MAKFEIINTKAPAPPIKTYTVLIDTSNGGIAEGAGVYNEGNIVTIKAIPQEGFNFLSIKDLDTEEEFTTSQFSFTITSNKNFLIGFESKPVVVPPKVQYYPFEAVTNISNFNLFSYCLNNLSQFKSFNNTLYKTTPDINNFTIGEKIYKLVNGNYVPFSSKQFGINIIDPTLIILVPLIFATTAQGNLIDITCNQ